MAILSIGRSKYYRTKTPPKILSDAELLEKEKRITETNKKRVNSKLFSIWYSVKGFFVAPEFIDSNEAKRLKLLRNDKSSMSTIEKAKALRQEQLQQEQRQRNQESIWTQPPEKK